MTPRHPAADGNAGAYKLPALLIAFMIVAAALFFAVALDIVTGDTLGGLDQKITAWFHTHATPGLTRFFLVYTDLHAMLAISIYTAVLALALAYKHEWRWLLTVGCVVPGGLALNWLLKQAYQRARPVVDEPLLTLSTYSFPSAHMAGAALFYGVVAAFLISRLASVTAKIAYACAAVVLAALVGLSRIYLGVHYLSDVLAAAAASSAWLALCLVCIQAHYARRVATR